MSTPRTAVRPSVVVPTAPRLAARARAERLQRRRRLRGLLWRGLLLAVVLAGLGWVLFVSSLLAVRQVEVTGTARITQTQVRTAADVPAGRPLARVDTAQIARRVSALAPVAAVQVRRSWPRTLRIQVTERVAAVGVVGPAGVTLLDPGGVVFATDRALPTGVVRLQVNDPGPDDAATRACLAVLAELPPALGDRVRIVRAETAASVLLLLDNGKQVVWGAPGGAATKAAAAVALLRREGDVFDVSTPGVAIIR